jgi:hypothetical protein
MNLNTHKYIHTQLAPEQSPKFLAIHAKGEIYFVAKEIFAKTSFTLEGRALVYFQTGVYRYESLPFALPTNVGGNFVFLYLALLFRRNLFLTL